MFLFCNNKKGFTLIELLVAISIISLLSTVILSALQNARRNATNTAINASVNQWLTAFKIYEIDNERHLYQGYPFNGESTISFYFLGEPGLGGEAYFRQIDNSVSIYIPLINPNKKTYDYNSAWGPWTSNAFLVVYEADVMSDITLIYFLDGKNQKCLSEFNVSDTLDGNSMCSKVIFQKYY